MTFKIRKAVLGDIDQILELAMEALNDNAYPGLVIDRVKLYNLATQCISAATNFAWVAEKDTKIVAAVLAIVQPMMCYEKSQASVVQFYSKVSGAGVKLIRKFIKWVKSRPVIRIICFTLEVQADPRIGKLLNRLGFSNELPVYMMLM